jgi:hypothetical protein
LSNLKEKAMTDTPASSTKQQLSAQFNQLAHQLGVLTFQVEAVTQRMRLINDAMLVEEAKEKAADE